MEFNMECLTLPIDPTRGTSVSRPTPVPHLLALQPPPPAAERMSQRPACLPCNGMRGQRAQGGAQVSGLRGGAAPGQQGVGQQRTTQPGGGGRRAAAQDGGGRSRGQAKVKDGQGAKRNRVQESAGEWGHVRI